MAAPIIAIAAAALVVSAALLALRALHTRRADRAHELHAGDYVASGGRLYRIEHVRRERVLIEDCGNGDLFDAGVSDVKQLPVVKCCSGQSCERANTSSGGKRARATEGAHRG